MSAQCAEDTTTQNGPRSGGTSASQSGPTKREIPTWLKWTVNAWIWVAIVCLLSALVMIFSTGCMAVRAKGGHATAVIPGASSAVNQPENPKDSSTSDLDGETEETFVYPAGTVFLNETGPDAPRGGTRPTAEGMRPTGRIVLSEPMPVTRKTRHHAVQSVGAAQPDVVGKTIAVLKSVRWIQVVGMALVLLGILTFAWPPARAVVNSATTSVLIIGFGLALIFVTPFISLHPGICIGIALGVCGLYWFAHHHGELKATAQTLKDMLSPKPPGN